MTRGEDGFIRTREPDPAALRSASTELTRQNVAVAGSARSGGHSDTGPAAQPPGGPPVTAAASRGGRGRPGFGVRRAETLQTTGALRGRSGGRAGAWLGRAPTRGKLSGAGRAPYLLTSAFASYLEAGPDTGLWGSRAQWASSRRSPGARTRTATGGPGSDARLDLPFRSGQAQRATRTPGQWAPVT